MESIRQDGNGASRTDEPKPDDITVLVGEISALLSRLLELIISRASAQSASVSVPLIRRLQTTERRLETQAKEISDLHRRFDTRAEQIDDQEARITALEAREVGGGE